MKIKKITIKNEGYIQCRSGFYTSQDGLSADEEYCFHTGINKLCGEIDSGVWAVSYLLSMYKHNIKEFILFDNPEVTVNDTVMPLDDFLRYSCYMDESYPLFSTKNSVEKMVAKGIRKNKLDYSTEEIRDLFCIHPARFERPLTGVGNEIFKCMAAIAYCHEKEGYCFPWLSKMRFASYHYNMTGLLEILARLDKIVISPRGEY